MATRGHDDIVPCPCSGNAPFLSTPTHHSRLWSQPTHQDLIPPKELTPLAQQVTLDALDHIALELMVVFQTFLLHASLAIRA